MSITLTKLTANEIHNSCDINTFQRGVKSTKNLYKELISSYTVKREENVREVEKVAVIAKCKEDGRKYLLDGKQSTSAAKEAGWNGRFCVQEIVCETRKDVAAKIIELNTYIAFSSAKKFALDFEVRSFLIPIADELVAMGLIDKYADEKEDGVTIMTIGDMFCSFIARNIFTDRKARHNVIIDGSSHIAGFIKHMKHLALLKKTMKDQASKAKFNEVSFLIGFAATGRLSEEDYVNLNRNSIDHFKVFVRKMAGVARGTDKPKGWRQLFINAANA